MKKRGQIMRMLEKADNAGVTRIQFEKKGLKNISATIYALKKQGHLILSEYDDKLKCSRYFWHGKISGANIW
jgi:hypothetical protein